MAAGEGVDVVDLARKGENDAVLAALEGGWHPDTKDAVGFTALMCAAGQGNLRMVRKLLDAGADPYVTCDCVTKRGWVAMDFALAAQEAGAKELHTMELPQVVFLLAPKDAVDDDEREDDSHLPPQYRRK